MRIPAYAGLDVGNKLYMKTHADVEEFSTDSLKVHPCESCALFYVYLDGTYEAFFKYIYDVDEGDDSDEEKEITYAYCCMQGDDRHFFAQLDGRFRFCCYSLLIEVEDGVYEVCV